MPAKPRTKTDDDQADETEAPNPPTDQADSGDTKKPNDTWYATRPLKIDGPYPGAEATEFAKHDECTNTPPEWPTQQLIDLGWVTTTKPQPAPAATD